MRALGIIFGTIIAIPILMIVAIGYLLFVPFDIIRYHKMPYYKDFNKKYRFFITSKDIVQLYNKIVKENLPIEYYCNNNFEYFVKDNQVLICDWSHEKFEEIEEQWYFDIECESGDVSSKLMSDVLLEEVENVLPEHKELPAKFVMFYSEVKDAEIFEEARKCPYFYCVFSVQTDL